MNFLVIFIFLGEQKVGIFVYSTNHMHNSLLPTTVCITF